jgi:hypothetical protein
MPKIPLQDWKGRDFRNQNTATFFPELFSTE